MLTAEVRIEAPPELLSDAEMFGLDAFGSPSVVSAVGTVVVGVLVLAAGLFGVMYLARKAKS